MDEHLIGDGLWQRVLEGLRSEPYMHLNDLGRVRRFVSACFVVLRGPLHLGGTRVLRAVR